MKRYQPSGFVKVRRGGECFWAEIVSQDATGAMARCDSHTVDPDAPAYNSMFRISNDEDLFGAMSSLPRPHLRIVK